MLFSFLNQENRIIINVAVVNYTCNTVKLLVRLDIGNFNREFFYPELIVESLYFYIYFILSDEKMYNSIMIVVQ